MSQIVSLHAREILDSRGNPTVEVDAILDDGSSGRASVPSGASTGKHEALELRDKDPHIYLGKSVEKAIEHIHQDIFTFLKDEDAADQFTIDEEMILHDGTPNLSRFGANAILAVSLAVSKAVTTSQKIPYYQYIANLYQKMNGTNGTTTPFKMPIPMFNVLNGGAHTDWQSTDIQEFMIVPLLKVPFSEHLRMCAEIYHHLEEFLKAKGYTTLVGDEGGFAPQVRSDKEALEALLHAIEKAGYTPGKEIGIAIDAASSQFWKDGKYELRVHKKTFSSEEMTTMWESWVHDYPIFYLEDGLAEDDWSGWQHLNQKLGGRIEIIGDDLLVTNTERIQKAIDRHACNTLLMKVNQIGTLTESLQAIALAKKNGWKVVVSHRSGETEDNSIADISVGTGAEQIKTGAPARSERLSKYNQLLRIEEQLNG